MWLLGAARKEVSASASRVGLHRAGGKIRNEFLFHGRQALKIHLQNGFNGFRFKENRYKRTWALRRHADPWIKNSIFFLNTLQSSDARLIASAMQRSIRHAGGFFWTFFFFSRFCSFTVNGVSFVLFFVPELFSTLLSGYGDGVQPEAWQPDKINFSLSLKAKNEADWPCWNLLIVLASGPFDNEFQTAQTTLG